MNKVLIIAEAGVNHNGKIELARQLIDKAAEAGVDYVKFQTFKAENLLTEYAEKAPYQKDLTDTDESQFEMIKKLEINREMHLDLLDYCKEKNVGFMSSPFDIDSLELLMEIGVDMIKIPSGEIVNYPLLRQIGETGKPVIMSTGMSNLSDIEAAVKVLREFGTREISLLHCNTEYPTPYGDVNLKVMDTLKSAFGLPVGFSDHTEGIEVPIAAVALGATVIEKHFTLDKTLPGPDHKASLDPEELKSMVKSVRHIECALGSSVKQPTESEKMNMGAARKSIVAQRNILEGELFSEENLSVKRPGTGLSPMLWNVILGSRASRDFVKDELIEL